jgi:riboflavin synthase
MFTGLIEELGTVLRVQRQNDRHILTIQAHRILGDQNIGDSIAVDGTCQTITAMSSDEFTVEALQGTLEKTTLGQLRPGQTVNLERALATGQRLGGHLVQGHIQGTGVIRRIQKSGENIFFSLDLSPILLRYCIPEGSIALQGVSLTIYEKDPQGITMNIIPHTWEATCLKNYRRGQSINVETDLIARHIETLLEPLSTEPGLTEASLKAWGY